MLRCPLLVSEARGWSLMRWHGGMVVMMVGLMRWGRGMAVVVVRGMVRRGLLNTRIRCHGLPWSRRAHTVVIVSHVVV